MDTSKMTVAKLQRMFEEGMPVTVLDVRPQEQRDEWKIAESVHMNIYHRLVEGRKDVLDHISLSKEIPVVTVCAAGKTSQIAADILNEKGYNAYSLAGGMKAWNYAWNIAEISTDKLTLIQVRRVAKGCLSYIIGSKDEAIVVDASLEPDVYLAIASKYNWSIKFVMDTHTHADYISRTIELAKASGAVHLFTDKADVGYTFTPFADEEEIAFGDVKLKCIHTPGHTPESACYLVNDRYLLTGDTLFLEGVGRPDLKADKEQAIQKANHLFASLQKIKSLGKEVIILPAHTSGAVAFDRQIIGGKLGELLPKIGLLSLDQSNFVEQTIQRIPATPPNYLQIAAINKAGNHDGIDPADLEMGANRCAVS